MARKRKHRSNSSTNSTSNDSPIHTESTNEELDYTVDDVASTESLPPIDSHSTDDSSYPTSPTDSVISLSSASSPTSLPSPVDLVALGLPSSFASKSKGNKKRKQTDETSKYWSQRYRLFSRFDQGIQLDQESWFSVTPEAIAKHIAEHCRCNVLLDAFVGAGGNAIQFAMTCNMVIGVDIDANKLRMTRHNASIYEVSDYIDLIQADSLQLIKQLYHKKMVSLTEHSEQQSRREDEVERIELKDEERSEQRGEREEEERSERGSELKDEERSERENEQHSEGLSKQQNEELNEELSKQSNLQQGITKSHGNCTVDTKHQITKNNQSHSTKVSFPDVIFLSPPWGGPNYQQNDTYDLTNMAGFINLIDLTRQCLVIAPKVVAFIPRNSLLEQLDQVISELKGIGNVEYEVEQNLINGKVKTLTVYFEVKG